MENDETKDLQESPGKQPDELDRGIVAAFGFDVDQDSPTARSVLAAFREKGHASRVTLRETDDEPSPLALSSRDDVDEDVWSTSRYQIAGEIARGGVGSVLKARDIDLGRDVALKVILNSHRGNPEMVRRFLEEAQIGGQLQHPGIVPIHEVGVLADERPYFAMKLVKGQTLAELLDARTSPEEDRQRFVGIFEQVCQTLAYAHTRGVIHRDLKPSNIMVGTFGEVQVMDWGLAKVLPKGGAADDARTTRRSYAEIQESIRTARSESAGSNSIAGSVMGTPAYMPPEQANGDVHALDERSDVFGLGAILCEILTGKPPYTGKSVDDVFELARRSDTGDARRRLEASGVDRELVRLVDDCLQADAGERPRNALVVAKRVRDHLESAERRARELQIRTARIRLKLVLSLLVLSVVVLGGGGYLFVDYERQARERTSVAAITDAMTGATELRARSVFDDDPSLWETALRESSRALELARESVGGEPFLEDAQKLHTELTALVIDRRTKVALERLREDRDDDSEEREYRFREVFDEYGIDLENEDTTAAVERIQKSEIRNELVLALDQWWATSGRQGRGRSRRLRDRLIDIAQQADSDSWRQSLRQAIRERDQEKLASLAEEANSRELAPSTLEVLSFSLRDHELREKVLERAQELHPQDFWINLRLGDHLRRGDRSEEASQYLRAAVALRPHSAYAIYKLGSALEETGATGAAVAKFRESIEREPSQRFGLGYSKCARLIAEHPENVPRSEVERLRETLEAIDAREEGARSDGRARLLVETMFALGEREKAIVALETRRREVGDVFERFRLPSGFQHESTRETLARMRAAVLPDLVSFASVDDAISEAQKDPAKAIVVEGFVKQFAADTSPRVRARLAYLDARKLQNAGSVQEAADKFAEVIALDDRFAEPFLHRARCLKDAGDAKTAERVLREALSRDALQFRTPWDLWTELGFVDLKMSPAEMLDHLPARVSGDSERDSRHGADVAWLLSRLARGEPIRINCGGSRHVDASGVEWGRDRFFTERSGTFLARSASRGTGDDLLERTFRGFPSGSATLGSGYEIPLPEGRYRIGIRVTEMFGWRSGRRGGRRGPRGDPGPRDRGDRPSARPEPPRELSVSAEGVDVSVGSPGAQVDVEVTDGRLELHFRRSFGAAHPAAIEVLRLP